MFRFCREKSVDGVLQDYDLLYNQGIEKLEASLSSDANPKPFRFNNAELINMRVGGYISAHLAGVADAIRQLNPSSVQEIGFGSGKNLLYMAARFPEIDFSGYELTPAGVVLAKKLQTIGKLPPNLDNLIGKVPDECRESILNIDFKQGNAMALPLSDKSVDLTYTILALEQMAPILPDVLKEIRRTTRRYVVMVEPFGEAQTTENKIYLRARNYFRQSMSYMDEAGFEPVAQVVHLPCKLLFGAAMLVARVKD